jgi:hypothetical protein
MGAFTEHGMTLTDGETVTVKLDIIAIKVFWHGERLKNLIKKRMNK